MMPPIGLATLPTSRAVLAPAVGRLILSQFRSYDGLDLAVEGRLVALTGENGAGKTNILEALSLFTAGRGLRRAELSAMPRQGGPGTFAISVALRMGDADVQLGTGSERRDRRRPRPRAAASTARRSPRPEPSPKCPRRLAHAGARRPVTGAAGDRRRFLDRLVLAVDAEHGARVNALERALRSRNRLLEDEPPDPAWLDAVEREVAETGVAVSAARRETVERLAALIAAGRDDASPFPWASLALRAPLEAELPIARPSTSRISTAPGCARAVRATAPRAARWSARRRPTSPCATARRASPAAQASTGEQKALLVGLVLAHARLVAAMTGDRPLVLLDEVAAHLDPAPPRRLVRIARTRWASQVWMTGADPAVFADLPTGAEAGAQRSR